MTHAAPANAPHRRRDRLAEWPLKAGAAIALSLCVVVLAALVLGSLLSAHAVRSVPPPISVWPLVLGTVVTTLIALLVAVPTGLLAAIYLSEFASPTVRRGVKPVLEFLAGIPTVVYGYFALVTLTPILRSALPHLGTFNALSAGLALGIMIVPVLFSLCDDALRAVPRDLREGAFALGASRSAALRRIILPSASSGISGAVVVSVARAMGESMIVAIAAGGIPLLTLDPREPMGSLASHILLGAQGTSASRLFAVGALLFLLTAAANAVAFRLARPARSLR